MAPHSGHVAPPDVGDVLDDDPAWSKFFKDPPLLVPEARARGGGVGGSEPSHLTRDGQVLAGKAPADDVDGREVVGAYRVYVVESLHGGPVTREDVSRVRITFHLPNDGTEACAFQAEFQAADTREEGADREGQRCASSASSAARIAARADGAAIPTVAPIAQYQQDRPVHTCSPVTAGPCHTVAGPLIQPW